MELLEITAEGIVDHSLDCSLDTLAILAGKP
jgi:hypothetical protein